MLSHGPLTLCNTLPPFPPFLFFSFFGWRHSKNKSQNAFRNPLASASFVDKTTMTVTLTDGTGTKTITAPKIVIACGGTPWLGDIAGAKE